MWSGHLMHARGAPRAAQPGHNSSTTALPTLTRMRVHNIIHHQRVSPSLSVRPAPTVCKHGAHHCRPEHTILACSDVHKPIVVLIACSQVTTFTRPCLCSRSGRRRLGSPGSTARAMVLPCVRSSRKWKCLSTPSSSVRSAARC